MANKKKINDCDICEIASPANCMKCEVNIEDSPYSWIEKDDIDWEDVYKRSGAWR